MAQCISRSTGKPMGLIQGDAAQQKALCINFGNTYIDDDGNQFQAQSPEENFTESGAVNTDLTVENENARQNAFEIEKAKIRAQEEEKAKLDAELAAAEARAKTTEVVVQPKETKVLDNNELLNIVSDNDNNLDKVITETSGEKGVKTTYENKRDKPKEAEDTTPVANTDIYTGKTIQTGGKKKEEPSAVMEFLKGTGNVALAGTGAAIYGGAKYANEALGAMDFSDGVQGGGDGPVGAGSAPYIPSAPYQGGQTLEQALPSIDPIAPVGAQISPYVDDNQFVDTMDGQLSEQGYMDPSMDSPVGPQDNLETMALDGAPQYDIQDLQTGGGFTPDATISLDRQMSGADGSSLDSRMSGLPTPGMMQTPEEVIAGAQGLVDQTAGAIPPQQLAQLSNETSLGDIQGMFGGVGDALTSMADGANAAVESAIQGIEQALIGTGLIDDPQAIEAVNTFVQEVDKLAEEQQTEEVTDDDLDTLMMQAEFDAEMLDEEYDSRAQRLPDRWAPKDEESTLDSITSFLGGLLADFTKLTGITSQELMRALVMYAGSRLFGYSAHDSAQFAFKNFANGVQDNWTAQMKDHDYYKKEQSKILDKYNGNKEDPGYQTEIAALDRTVANNNMTYAEKVLLKQAESKIKVDETELVEEIKTIGGIEEKQAGTDIKGTAELQKKATADAETGYMQRVRNTQLRQMLADGNIETGAWTGNLMQAARSFLTDTIGVKELESATGEVLYNYTVNEVLKFISQTKGAISEKEMKVFAEAALGRMKSSLGLKVLLETSDKIVRFQIKYDKALSDFVSDWKKNPDNKAKQSPPPEEVRKWQHQWNKDNELVLPTAKLLQNAEGGEAMQNAINATSSIAQINELFGGRKPTREEQEMVIARVKKAKAADGDWDGTSISTKAPAY